MTQRPVCNAWRSLEGSIMPTSITTIHEYVQKQKQLKTYFNIQAASHSHAVSKQKGKCVCQSKNLSANH